MVFQNYALYPPHYGREEHGPRAEAGGRVNRDPRQPAGDNGERLES
jgi:hypothetical protein